ncbi:MAG: hypothetical protein FWG11_02230, partial [Promicromonosporaceae bacterium]|nr:hypothetical protein [Promicromonosporaceae bacterium]
RSFGTLPGTAKRLVWSHESRGFSPGDDGAAKSVALGAPFAYLLATLGARVPSLGSGTVVFPTHGAKAVALTMDDAEFAREVFSREGAATICLHADDLRDPAALAPWLDAGHQVVSCGRRGDPQFILRALAILTGAGKIVSNQVTTAVMYGTSLGMDSEIYGPEAKFHGTSVLDQIKGKWPEFFDASVPAEQRQAIARQELGFQHVLPAPELRALLGWGCRSPVGPWRYWVSVPVRKVAANLGLAKTVDLLPSEAGAPQPRNATPLELVRSLGTLLPGRLPGGVDLTKPLPPPLRPGSAVE